MAKRRTKQPAAQVPDEMRQPGVYLTDGTHLVRVVDAHKEQVLLEDAMYPEDPVWRPAMFLRKHSFRAVNRAESAGG